MLPKPKPIIVSVYGSDAPARATPNSACTAGSATTTDHIPTPPSVDKATPAHRRCHAWGESTPRFALIANPPYAIRFLSSGGVANVRPNAAAESASFTPARLIAPSSTLASGV